MYVHEISIQIGKIKRNSNISFRNLKNLITFNIKLISNII